MQESLRLELIDLARPVVRRHRDVSDEATLRRWPSHNDRMTDDIQIPAGETRPLPLAVRVALLALALLSLGMAVVGIFLPVVPTVPFVLLAAWAAARSSPKLNAWLEAHPRMGPMIVDWRRGGVVRRGAKWTASGLMGLSAVSMLVLFPGRWLPYVAIACMATVLVWLWRRPEK
jgi:uncharacterized membrane protein YbaN (DUF454 family)